MGRFVWLENDVCTVRSNRGKILDHYYEVISSVHNYTFIDAQTFQHLLNYVAKAIHGLVQ